MKHVRLLVIMVFLILAALSGTAVLVGRAHADEGPSNALQTMGLDACNGKLCFMQLVPGVTTMEQARQAMASYMFRDDGGDFHSRVGGFEVRIDGEDGSGIQHVDIQAPANSGPSSVPFSEIIRQFGTPCYVSQVMSYDGSIVLTYPSFQLHVAIEEQGRLSLDSTISGVTLADAPTGNLCDGDDPYGTPWRGFASANIYEAQNQFDR